uniref:Uncharacterized protein n=1 Tax=Anguilla anguilla TaxID=7936 RepID=A0A0E9W1Q4_ANGAN
MVRTKKRMFSRKGKCTTAINFL